MSDHARGEDPGKKSVALSLKSADEKDQLKVTKEERDQVPGDC